MNNVNYQPTGVYPQFVSDPSLLNSKGQNADNENKNSKKRGYIIALAVTAGAAAAGAAVAQYKKGTNAIKLKNEVFRNYPFKYFIEKEKYSESEVNYFKQIWDNGIKYSNGLTGKIHDSLIKIGNFFRDNFYKY
ncbi:MAG: hypothetical protein LUE64_05360 [Candidatus Gastranaerophilales bacterium]|nr:hypothetical protein [Candidatus Gastranaerophilales bacterium]